MSEQANNPVPTDGQTSDEILEAATAFQNEANTLMSMMAKKFGFDLNTIGSLTREARSKNHFHKGELAEEWTFYFHGSDCCFENTQTGQILEVHYLHPPEFGYLDGYFFYKYLQSTPAFQSLAAKFGSHAELWHAVEWMANEGILTYVQLDTTKKILVL